MPRRIDDSERGFFRRRDGIVAIRRRRRWRSLLGILALTAILVGPPAIAVATTLRSVGVPIAMLLVGLVLSALAWRARARRPPLSLARPQVIPLRRGARRAWERRVDRATSARGVSPAGREKGWGRGSYDGEPR